MSCSTVININRCYGTWFKTICKKSKHSIFGDRVNDFLARIFNFNKDELENLEEQYKLSHQQNDNLGIIKLSKTQLKTLKKLEEKNNQVETFWDISKI